MGTIWFLVISLNRSLHSCPLSLSVEPFRSDRLWLLLFHVWDGCGNLKGDGLESWPCRSLPLCGPAALGSPRNFLEMQTLRSYSDLLSQNLPFNKIPWWFVCVSQGEGSLSTLPVGQPDSYYSRIANQAYFSRLEQGSSQPPLFLQDTFVHSSKSHSLIMSRNPLNTQTWLHIRITKGASCSCC